MEKGKLAIKRRATISEVEGNYLPCSATYGLYIWFTVYIYIYIVLEIKQPERLQKESTVHFDRKVTKQYIINQCKILSAFLLVN